MERRSCCSLLMLCLLLAVAVSMWGFTRVQNQLTKKLTAKLEAWELDDKKTELSLKNVEIELENRNMQLDIDMNELKELENEVKLLTSDQEKKAKEAKACQDSVVKINEEITVKVKERSDNEGNFNAIKLKWTEQINGLKKKLEERSPVCAFVKNSTANGQCIQATIKSIPIENQKQS